MKYSKPLTIFAIGILSLTSCGQSKRYEAIKATQEKIVNNKDYQSGTGNLSLLSDYDQDTGTSVDVYLKAYDIEENDRFDLFVVVNAGSVRSKVDLLFYNDVKNVEGYMWIYSYNISSTSWIYGNEFIIKDSYTLGSREYTLRGETNQYPNEIPSSTAYRLLDSMLELGISSFNYFCKMNALSAKVFFPNVA